VLTAQGDQPQGAVDGALQGVAAFGHDANGRRRAGEIREELVESGGDLRVGEHRQRP
jgi:hypothetical protein